MNYFKRAVIAGAAVFLFFVATPVVRAQDGATNGIAPVQKCADLVNLKIPGSTMVITKAEAVPTTPPGTIRASFVSPDTIPVAIPPYCRADGVIALAALYQRAPCRVLFPTTEAGEPLQAVLLTTSGGLTGGDRTRVSVTVEPSARATVTTQAAEKIYRALPGTGDAVVQVEMQVGDGAWAEWLAQEKRIYLMPLHESTFEYLKPTEDQITTMASCVRPPRVTPRRSTNCCLTVRTKHS